MSQITTIGSESIEEFIRRHPSGVFTTDIAGRFGMYRDDALIKLKRMERAGTIYSERETAGGSGAFLGAGLVWRICQNQQVTKT